MFLTRSARFITALSVIFVLTGHFTPVALVGSTITASQARPLEVFPEVKTSVVKIQDVEVSFEPGGNGSANIPVISRYKEPPSKMKTLWRSYPRNMVKEYGGNQTCAWSPHQPGDGWSLGGILLGSSSIYKRIVTTLDHLYLRLPECPSLPPSLKLWTTRLARFLTFCLGQLPPTSVAFDIGISSIWLVLMKGGKIANYARRWLIHFRITTKKELLFGPYLGRRGRVHAQVPTVITFLLPLLDDLFLTGGEKRQAAVLDGFLLEEAAAVSGASSPRPRGRRRCRLER